jgi:hypothetical protein
MVCVGTRVGYAQEMQVPFDSAGNIMAIDSQLNNSLDLFPEYPHLIEAQLFLEPDSSYRLYARVQENGKIWNAQTAKTKSEILGIRRKVEGTLPSVESSGLWNMSARSKFIGFETALSLLAYGPLISWTVAPNATTQEPWVMFGAGALGYLISWELTRNASMTDGEASLALGGAFIGAAHGAILDNMVTDANVRSEIGASIAASSIVETGIGYAVAHANHLSEGSSDIIRYAGVFGLLDGAGIAGAINNKPSPYFWGSCALGGSAIGFGMGALLANDAVYTRGNATVVGTAGWYGSFLAVLLSTVSISPASLDNVTTTLALSGVVGNIACTYFAHEWMRGKHFTTGEGNWVAIATLGGSYVGEGVGLLVSRAAPQSIWPLVLSTVVGTAAGFALTVDGFGAGSDISRSKKMGSNWKVDVNPIGLMGSLSSPTRTRTEKVIPAVSLTCAF